MNLRLLLLIPVITLFCLSSCGQDATDTNNSTTVEQYDFIENIIDRFRRKVDLTNAQASQIRQIFSEYNFEEMSNEAYLELKPTLKKRVLEEVLTKEQIQKLDGQ